MFRITELVTTGPVELSPVGRCDHGFTELKQRLLVEWNKNLAIANRSRISCAHYVEGIYRSTYP